ncbi:MAG TPA: condensation domain-containing protein, partial [Stellaceae bacterium]|nr:condensation domain-containing protein [Stellaceae bacterium]
NEVLLTALALTLQRQHSGDIVIDLEGHGREEIGEAADLSRTVGWFTTLFPFRLDLKPETPARALRQVKERLRAVPRKGMGFGLLRYLNPDTAPLLAAAPARDILFNYLGQLDVMGGEGWHLSSQSPGPMAAPHRERTHLLEIEAMVKGGALRIEWTWCRNTHEERAILALADGFLEALRGLIAHCREPGTSRYTPSDFPLITVTEDRLNAILHRFPDLQAIYPLTPLQHGLWFHALYERDADPYHVQLRMDLAGRARSEPLRRAWQRLMERHEALRIAIIDLDGTPAQVVRQNLPLPWHEEDWSGLDDAAFSARLQSFLAEDRKRGFDFAQGPLLRVALLRGRENSVMVLSAHHILFDGWSLPILLEELQMLYGARQLSLPRPYGDYLAWLQGRDQEEAARYWRRRLDGFSPPSTGLPAPSVAGSGRAERRAALSPEASESLRHFARRHRLTLATLLQGAWALLLARYTRHSDLVFGVTVAGRNGEVDGIERMVGLFINTLPTRVTLEHGASLVPWLERLHAHLLEDQRYGYASLAAIQGERRNLFDTLLVIENYPLPASFKGGGLAVTGLQAIEHTHYPLSLVVEPGSTLALRMSFAEARFDSDLVERLLLDFEELLASMVRAPEAPLRDFLELPPRTHQLVIKTWNATEATVPDTTLPALFAAQTRRDPSAIALDDGDEQVSYGALGTRVTALAAKLRRRGVGPEQVVGVCLERSFELVVALMAVLEAGGAYLPLDPASPVPRRVQMIAEAGARLVLDAPTLAALAAEPPAAASPPALRPDHLAYVIFTSGSTGTPKGVAVSHGSLTNKLLTLGPRLGVGPGFGIALLTAPGF